MARTALTPVSVTRSGLALPATPAPATDLKFVNTGAELLIVSSVGGCTVTLNVAKKVDGQQPAAKTVAVGAGVTKIIGPFPTAAYNQAGGVVNIDLDTTTDTTIDVVKVPGLSEA